MQLLVGGPCTGRLPREEMWMYRCVEWNFSANRKSKGAFFNFLILHYCHPLSSEL